MMKNIIKKTWRESASLIVAARQCQEALSCGAGVGVNYDILLQTRGKEASSFANSVVFPGGVTEPADASAEWVLLIKSFGFPQSHFDALHCPGAPVTPIFQDDPVQRHISLRITAIRETFEELGVLICSKTSCGIKREFWAEYSTQFDVKQWQNKVSKNPEELFNLCRELNCYPDIWSLHYWSDWLTPSTFEKRFDTAFFVTAFKDKLADIRGSSEVANFEWGSPPDILKRNRKGEVILFPPQVYEFNRLLELPDIEDLISFSKERSGRGNELLYPVIVRTKDGLLHLLPGDDLYPKTIEDYNNNTINRKDKTVEELRENCSIIHRFERTGSRSEFVIKNFKPLNHITMEDKVIQVHN